MSNNDATFEKGRLNLVPGLLLDEKSYKGLSDHPEYMKYLRLDKGEAVWFIRPEIMNIWTDKPLISEGFSICYPLIAVRPSATEAQAIHVSRDPWFKTDTDDLWKRVDEWKEEGDKLLLVSAPQSALSQDEILELANRFGDRFAHISLGIDSRFGMVYDVLNQILLVQLTDAKLLRIYQGFGK